MNMLKGTYIIGIGSLYLGLDDSGNIYQGRARCMLKFRSVVSELLGPDALLVVRFVSE